VAHDGKNLAPPGVMWRRDGDQLAVSSMPSRSVLAEVRRSPRFVVSGIVSTEVEARRGQVALCPHMPQERTTKMAHTDSHAALLEYVANPTFYGAQPSSVRMLV
jgi:hypothetical protein